MADICALGELLVDFTPLGKEGYQYNPGGGPANMACMAVKRGASCSFISQVGDDEFGRKLKDKLTGEGVDTTCLTLSKAYPTTLAFVHHKENGERSFSFYRHGSADTMIEVTEEAKKMIDEAPVFYLSTVLMSEGRSRETSLELLKYAKEQGKIIAFDPNLRFNLWKSEKELQEVVGSMISEPHIIKMSEEELAYLTGEEGIITGIMKLQHEREEEAIMIITEGEEGCTIYMDGEMTHVDSFEVKPVDTTGAGDAFMGALLGEMAVRGLSAETITMEEMISVCDVACACGALTTTGMGGIDAQPTKEQVEKLFEY